MSFQFTHPGKGATCALWCIEDFLDVSIHAPWEGCDVMSAISSSISRPSFNSRTPGGVRLLIERATIRVEEFQFTHPGRGATYLVRGVGNSSFSVSIHAPREGCDFYIHIPDFLQAEVSIHAPREGCDVPRQAGGQGADVSIHAPREGCDSIKTALEAITKVSIHAPREGCDVLKSVDNRTPEQFQFTHPGRGATSL